jgi:hypothetical protein
MMANREQNPISFLSGFVQSRDIARVIATIDELSEAGSSRTWLMKWTKVDGKWGRFVVPWSATRMCVLLNNGAYVYATGPEGKVAILTPSGSSEEVIDSSENGTRSRGPIRDLRAIEGTIYACGMARQVYRREGPNRWSRRDEGTVLPKGTLTVAGFNAIDGVSEGDIYAVGFGGEIWRCVASHWHQLYSPTNAILFRVRAVRNDLVYAAGQKGVLVQGNGDLWEPIEQTTTTADLWGMEWFKDRLFVSSDDAVYVLRDGQLENVSEGKLTTCGHLHANDGVMWSFGRKQVAWTENGVDWSDATP